MGKICYNSWIMKPNLILISISSLAVVALGVLGFVIFKDFTKLPEVPEEAKLPSGSLSSPEPEPKPEPQPEPQLSFEDLLFLGISKKNNKDYAGAVKVWEEASRLIPESHIPYSNLGDLYQFYLRDFPKAEQNLRKAVELYPGYIAGYMNLHELYRYQYKEKAELADDILEEGLRKNPGDPTLKAALASYLASGR